MRLVVIGAGITGLSGAYEALRRARAEGLDLEVTILEGDARAGGKLWTEREGRTAVEWGPDSFLASKPAARELAEELGLELVAPSPAGMRAYLLIDDELRPLPSGTVMGVPRGPVMALAAIRSGVIGLGAAVRAAIEPLLPGTIGDEAVSAVTRRRLGTGWSKRLVEPLVEGVYGAPAGGLGMRAALSAFAGSRSLLLAARRQPRPPAPPFVSIRDGMGKFAERLVEELTASDLRLRTPALGIASAGESFTVETPGESTSADAVLVAIPAPDASVLLHDVSESTARTLGGIRFSSSAVVLLRYPAGSLGRALDGSGYLVASGDGLVHAACSWLSSKWPESTPGNDMWLRAIVTSPDALRRTDEELGERVAREVGTVMRSTAEPSDLRVVRWDRALPVYAPGHLDRVRTVEGALPPRLAVAGASYRGLGVPDCIRDGRDAGARLVGQLLR